MQTSFFLQIPAHSNREKNRLCWVPKWSDFLGSILNWAWPKSRLDLARRLSHKSRLIREQIKWNSEKKLEL